MNLKEKPYYLNDEQIRKVNDLLDSMSLDEKIGQVFVYMAYTQAENEIKEICDRYHVGGVRWLSASPEKVYHRNKCFTEYSRIAPFIAANCEAGGNEVAVGGTVVASAAACGASRGLDVVRNMARVSAEEAGAVGANWVFGPICDILLNPKNTIVNTRSFGNDPDDVLAQSRAYYEVLKEHHILCATKHFPGDGSEERDQHLVMGCNDLDVEEWNATYGKVYKGLIDSGIQGIMAGHICQPAWSRALRPGIRDEEIKPATLAPELLQDLLREKLGFNGVIITDATHMGGLNAAASRKEALPSMIAAGCDMILFYNDPDEDMEYMREGIRNGILTEYRLNEAVLRILALKESAGILEKKFPDPEGLSCLGSEEHHAAARRAADASITLVKDTQNLLPVMPKERPRCLLYFIQAPPVGRNYQTDPAKGILIRELEKAGFQVTAPKDFYELELEDPNPINAFRMMDKSPLEERKKKYDFVLVAINMKGYAQTNCIRVMFSVGHSSEIPWYVNEIPTVCVSLQYTNHLFDVPMMKTYINAYEPTEEYIQALVEKLTGKSPFKGKANEIVWGGRWETRL